MIDKDPSKKAGQFEDLSEVEKYEISDEAYAKRTGACMPYASRNLHVPANILSPKIYDPSSC